MLAPTTFGFSAEFQGDHPAYDEFDKYLEEEFVNRDPHWEAKFGKATSLHPTENRYDYLYLLHGNVPDATSEEDAERKVHELIDRISGRLRCLEQKAGHAIPKPKIRVWRWP